MVAASLDVLLIHSHYLSKVNSSLPNKYFTKSNYPFDGQYKIINDNVENDVKNNPMAIYHYLYLLYNQKTPHIPCYFLLDNL